MCCLDQLRNTRFCINFVKYENYVNMISGLAIILNIVKVVFVAIEIPRSVNYPVLKHRDGQENNFLRERNWEVHRESLSNHQKAEQQNYQINAAVPFFAFVLAVGVLTIIMETILIYSVKKRNIRAIQHWVFITMLLFLIVILALVITTGVLKWQGLILSLALILNLIRIPPEVYYVHKFVKTENLDADSRHLAALYVKF